MDAGTPTMRRDRAPIDLISDALSLYGRHALPLLLVSGAVLLPLAGISGALDPESSTASFDYWRSLLDTSAEPASSDVAASLPSTLTMTVIFVLQTVFSFLIPLALTGMALAFAADRPDAAMHEAKLASRRFFGFVGMGLVQGLVLAAILGLALAVIGGALLLFH